MAGGVVYVGTCWLSEGIGRSLSAWSMNVMAHRSVVFLCLVCLLLACSAKPYALSPVAEQQPERSHLLYIVSHGWHTGLILSGQALNEAVPELENRFGTPAFYEIGWGDSGFYQAQKITSGLTVQAMFWSEGAALHLVAFAEEPAQYFEGEPVLLTCLSENELSALKRFLASSFSHTPEHTILPLRDGLYGNSAFYPGEGRYSTLNTCNTWTAKALKSSGFKIQPASKLTAGSIIRYVEKNARTCTEE